MNPEHPSDIAYREAELARCRVNVMTGRIRPMEVEQVTELLETSARNNRELAFKLSLAERENRALREVLGGLKGELQRCHADREYVPGDL